MIPDPLTAAVPAAAAEAAPAGGAALDQVIVATAFGVAVTVALLVLCLGHRSGRIGLLAWGGRLAERVSPMPAWASVPAFIALVTLLPTLFGLQWDEALHITQGRDEGPLANPSHYLLLQGIFGGFAAGVIALAMADARVPRSGLSLPGHWRVPIGGAITALGGGVALIGFPLDDVWHRLYGQDVTLWSPTHVTMIAGMSISVIGIVILIVEGLRAAGAHGGGRLPVPKSRARGPGGLLSTAPDCRSAVMAPGALLLVVSLLQGEFDYGVPQYRLLLHPMILLGGAALALVAARLFFGRGAALAAVFGFVVIRGAIALLVGPALDVADHVFPLYVVEALIVEAVALRVGERRPLALGLWAGGLIGTLGLAVEWAASGLFPYPWTPDLLPEAIPFSLAMALAGGAIGAWLGSHLMISDPIRTPALRWSAVAGAVVVTIAIGYGLQEGGGERITGSVTLSDVAAGGERTVDATLRLDPPDAADDAEWIHAIAWQGGGLISEPLERVGEGVYETRTPLPVNGDWKSVLRLQVGDRLLGLPIYLPEDPAIPVDGIAAPASFERDFVGEKALLQREAKDVGTAPIAIGTGLVALLCFGLLGLTAAALHRLAASAGPAGDPAAAAGAGAEHRRAPSAPAAAWRCRYERAGSRPARPCRAMGRSCSRSRSRRWS